MATMSFEQLEQHVIQLKPQEQLRLVARISERLSAIFQPSPKAINPMQEREEEVHRLLSLCDEAAEMWDGSFDAVEDIRQMRQEEENHL